MCSPCWNAEGTEELGELFGEGYVCIGHTGKEISFQCALLRDRESHKPNKV